MQQALKLFHEKTKEAIHLPNVVTYMTMLQGLFRVGRPRHARELFARMLAHKKIWVLGGF